VVVAYSGGVDSTLVAKLARDVLGRDKALAVTADSPSLAREDLDAATDVARALDLEQLVIRTSELSDPSYRANSSSRCYVCKRTLFEELEPIAERFSADAILYGAIGDDHADDRPGQRAATEHRVRAPLQEVGLLKWEVRELARQLGLPNWDRPQNACLSSRIPHGQDVTEEKLKQIEEAEAFLRTQGFRQVRVRHQGAVARIEVEPEAVTRFGDPVLRADVDRALRAVGFASVSIDPRGYHPGGADERPEDDSSEKWKVESRK
jgi:uncharacterized protein